jgi:hypothetical protein
MKKLTLVVLTMSACLGVSAMRSVAAETVFWEAESASDTNMTVNGGARPFNPQEAAKLSERSWLNGNVTDTTAYAHYAVQVPAAGTYRFFVRKYWQHGAFRWRFDGGDWTEVRKVKLFDSVVMREYVPVTWAQIGEVTLTAGEHKIDVEVLNDPTYQFNKCYAFDCFLLTTGEWEEFVKANPNLTAQP